MDSLQAEDALSQDHSTVEQPASRSVHSANAWIICDQGLFLPKSLMCSNEKWVSDGWSCAGQGSYPGTATVAGLAGYSKVVNTSHTFPLSTFSFALSHITLQDSADPIRPPKMQHNLQAVFA